MSFYAVILSGGWEGELNRSVCDLKGKLDDIFKEIYKTKIAINGNGSKFFLRVSKASGFFFFLTFVYLSFKSLTRRKTSYERFCFHITKRSS